MKSKDLHSRLLYPAKLSFRMEGQIKCYADKVMLKEFIITKPLLYEMIGDLFKRKKIKTMNNKMAKNTYLSIMNLKNKLSNKKNRDRIMDKENILVVAIWEGDMAECMKK